MTRRMGAIVVVLAIVALALVPATAVAGGDQFNEKFTFTITGLVDGEETDVTVEAGSKRTGGGSEFTVCSYFTDGYGEYLGQFESAEFASDDEDAVKQFCDTNFPNRDQDG